VNLSADYGLSAKITLYRTKSGKPRGLPINRAVHDALAALEPDESRRVGLVFKRRDGAAWGQIRTAFATALRRAGIKGFRFHDLRHTCASHMVMRGASLKDVQEILGHSDYKMTLRYAHLSPSHLRGALDRLDGLTPAPAASWAHRLAQSARIDREAGPSRLASSEDSSRAPVAQVDRAAVS
jgi:integrase